MVPLMSRSRFTPDSEDGAHASPNFKSDTRTQESEPQYEVKKKQGEETG